MSSTGEMLLINADHNVTVFFCGPPGAYPKIYNGRRGCYGGLEAEPPALENFFFFFENDNLILGIF